jgi:hypothetical protein
MAGEIKTSRDGRGRVDLGGGQLSSTCLSCAHERTRTEDANARADRLTQIALLETQRRSLIATLVKVDAKIAELRARPAPSSSASFKRVDPSDVFDGADSDLGFGD